MNAADWGELTAEQQAAIVAPSGEGRSRPRTRRCAARSRLARAVPRAGERLPAAGDHATSRPSSMRSTARACASRRGARGCWRAASSPRPSSPNRATSTVFRSVLECSLPHPTWGQAVEPAVVAAAHRAAWEASREAGGAWIHAFLAEQSLRAQARAAARPLQRPGRGLAGDRAADREREAGPGGGVRVRRLPGGARGQAADRRRGRERPGEDRGAADRREGEIAWQERLSEQGTSHPTIAADRARCWRRCEDGRLARARQFLTACVVRGIAIPAAAALEQQLDGCVT